MEAVKVKFNNQQSEFYPVLRKRIDQYFIDNNISKFANGKMIAITVFILTVYATTYGLLLSNLFGPAVLLVLAAIHGFFTAQIGLNVGHDTIHGAYSSKNKVNKRISLFFNLVGANDYVWSITHNILHHTFTNIPERDDDINQPPIIRISPTNKLWKIHRFQHIYAFFLYSIASLSWVFVKDYVKFFSKNLGKEANKKHPKKEYYRLFFWKFVYYTLFLAVPLMVIDYPWYSILLGFWVVHIFEGLTLALVFQLAHLVERTEFPEPDSKGMISRPWAIHQMYTTADFARKSELANLICGGLNFQIEHHLFPKICHIHYKAISPIVEETAKEFGVPFIDNETFFSAMASHINVLKKFGKEASPSFVTPMPIAEVISGKVLQHQM